MCVSLGFAMNQLCELRLATDLPRNKLSYQQHEGIRLNNILLKAFSILIFHGAEILPMLKYANILIFAHVSDSVWKLDSGHKLPVPKGRGHLKFFGKYKCSKPQNLLQKPVAFANATKCFWKSSRLKNEKSSPVWGPRFGMLRPHEQNQLFLEGSEW